MTDVTIITKKDGEEEERGIEARLREEHLQDQAKKAREFFAHMQSELIEIEGDLKDGLSYLDMKNDTLLSYMIDLCNIVLLKVRGESISGHSSVERCVAYRVILEKIKAIDVRLAYQLNKVISLPDGASDEGNGIDIDNLDVEVNSDKEEESGEEESGEEEEDDDDEEEEIYDEPSSRKSATKSAKSARKSGKKTVESDDEEEDEDFDGSSNGSQSDGQQAEDEMDDELKERLMRKQILAEKAESKKKDRSGRKSAGVYKPPKLRSVAYEGDFDQLGSRNQGRRKDYSDFYQDEEDADIVEATRPSRDEERRRIEEENYTRLPGDSVKRDKRKLRSKMAHGRKGNKKFKGGSKRGKIR